MPRVLRGLCSATRKAPVLDGLGDVRGANFVTAGQVGNSARHFENAVPGAGRQVELRCRLFEQLAASFIRLTAGVDFLGAQAGIGLALAGLLPGLGGFDPARTVA